MRIIDVFPHAYEDDTANIFDQLKAEDTGGEILDLSTSDVELLNLGYYSRSEEKEVGNIIRRILGSHQVMTTQNTKKLARYLLLKYGEKWKNLRRVFSEEYDIQIDGSHSSTVTEQFGQEHEKIATAENETTKNGQDIKTEHAEEYKTSQNIDQKTGQAQNLTTSVDQDITTEHNKDEQVKHKTDQTTTINEGTKITTENTAQNIGNVYGYNSDYGVPANSSEGTTNSTTIGNKLDNEKTQHVQGLDTANYDSTTMDAENNYDRVVADGDNNKTTITGTASDNYIEQTADAENNYTLNEKDPTKNYDHITANKNDNVTERVKDDEDNYTDRTTDSHTNTITTSESFGNGTPMELIQKHWELWTNSLNFVNIIYSDIDRAITLNIYN